MGGNEQDVHKLLWLRLRKREREWSIIHASSVNRWRNKSSAFFKKMLPKKLPQQILFKQVQFSKLPKSHHIFGLLCEKICNEEISKLAQSGYTAPKLEQRLRWRKRKKERGDHAPFDKECHYFNLGCLPFYGCLNVFLFCPKNDILWKLFWPKEAVRRREGKGSVTKFGYFLKKR